MINQTVIVELSVKTLLSKQFNLQKEIALILKQSKDDYAALIKVLKDKGMTDVVDYLDKHEVPRAYINVDYENAKFYARNYFSKAVDFLVPFSFNAAELDLDIEENMVTTDEKNDDH